MTASETYRKLRNSQRLLLLRDEVRWHSQLTGSEPQSEIVVNFNCALQYTPHVMLEMLDVLDALGVKVSGVAGPQWCCGMSVDDEDEQASFGVVRHSVRHLAAFGPRTAVQSCGGWWPQTQRLREAGEPVPFELQPLPEFIMQALQRGLDDVVWRDGPTRRGLVHLKMQDVPPEVRIERAASLGAVDGAIPEIMRMIPTVEIVGEAQLPSLGSPCEADDDDRTVMDALDPEQRAQVFAEFAEQGARTGADFIVCAHHRCAQDWGKFTSDEMQVRYYIDVLADAMGLVRPDRFHACWALPSIEDIVGETEPYWRSWEMDREEAASIATQLFPEHSLSRA